MSFQIYFTDMRQGLSEEIRVCVANSEEEFRNTTVEELKRKLIPGDQLGDTILVNFYFKTLKENRTLGFYGFKHEDHIIAVRRGSYYTRTTQPCSTGSQAHTGTIFYEDDDEDEGGGLPRTESMDRIALMQKTDP